MTDSNEEGKSKTDGRLLRALRYISKTDWKSLALMISLTVGAGGSTCNAAWTWVNDLRAGRANAGTYDLLATRINELAVRIEACEAKTAPVVIEAAPVPAPAIAKRQKKKHHYKRPAKTPEAPPAVATAAAPERLTEQTAVEVVIDAAPAYKSARLPGYGEIQQAAQEANMDNFIAGFR